MSVDPVNSTNPRPTFISTAPARALLAPLEQGLGARAPFLLITGEAGTGKTSLVAEVLRRWSDRVEAVELVEPVPEPAEMAATLLQLFGGSSRQGASAPLVFGRLLNVLANTTAGGRVAVLLVDDAHTLTPEHLLELHRIAEAAAQRQCPLELLLVGLPPLEAMFDEPPLDALERRIAVRGELSVLSANDTREYLMLRPNSAGGPSSGLFSRKACRDIHSASLGVLGTIEALAAESTRRALRDGASTVSPEHVRAAAHALRAGRADDAAHTLPPRRTRAVSPVESAPRVTDSADAESATPAPAPRTTPVPAPVKVAKPVARIAPTPTFVPERVAPPTPGSNDPRVQDWVARFGGSGVQIGARTTKRPLREPEFVEEIAPAKLAQVAKPAPRLPAAQARDAEAAKSEEPAAPVSKPRARIIAFPVTQPLSEAALAEAVRREEAVELFGKSAAAMEPRVVHAFTPREPLITLEWRMPPVTLLGVLGFAILALLFSQREAVGRMFPHVPAHAASAPVVPAPVEPIDVAPVVPNPLARVAPNQHSTRTPKTAQPRTSSGGGYAIAVGNYPTREMAMSECDYLGRLVTLRVHVAPAGAGKRGYRLLLGKYDDTEAAEVALHRLQGRGVATDAKVVEVPSAQNETHARHRRR